MTPSVFYLVDERRAVPLCTPPAGMVPADTGDPTAMDTPTDELADLALLRRISRKVRALERRMVTLERHQALTDMDNASLRLRLAELTLPARKKKKAAAVGEGAA